MFKTQISRKTQNSQLCLKADTQDPGQYSHGKSPWELPSLDSYSLTCLPQAPLCSIVSPSLWKLSFPWAFLHLLFTHVHDFASPRRYLNLFPFLNWKIKWTYSCYHYWYILIHVCQSLLCCLFVPQHQFLLSFLVFFWVDWVCCLTSLFSSCTTWKIILFFFNQSKKLMVVNDQFFYTLKALVVNLVIVTFTLNCDFNLPNSKVINIFIPNNTLPFSAPPPLVC